MRLKLFSDGTAIFCDRTPTNDLKIELSTDACVYIGEERYPTKCAVANIGKLAQGEYAVKVTCKGKKYVSLENLVVTDTGTVYVNDREIWKNVLKLSEHIEKLTARLEKAENLLKEYEERISGYSLFD